MNKYENFDLFSDWIKWNERGNHKSLLNPGVYGLIYSEKQLSNRPQISDELIYIGETCNQTVRARLNQFHRSAFEGKAGHSGGCNFFKKRKKLEKNPDKLYFCFISFPQDGVRSSTLIRYIERSLLLHYVTKHDYTLPKYNTK